MSVSPVPPLDDCDYPIPTQPDAMGILAHSRLLGDVGPRDLKRLLQRSTLSYVDRGDVLWKEGSPSRFFVVVGEGLVRMTRRSPQMREVTVEILGPGDCAGILASLNHTGYLLSAIAITNTWYLKVPNDVLVSNGDPNARLKTRLVEELAPRLLHAFDFAASMLSGSVEQRLALTLIRLCALAPPRMGESHPTLPITRQNLADIACTTVESTIRATAKWQKEGWIVSGHRSIKVLDREALRQIGQGDPGLVKA